MRSGKNASFITEKFDLVITDMNMPNMTGDRLTRKILAIRPDIPVVIATGYSQGLSPEEAAEIGVREMITKPFETGKFTRIVHQVLEDALAPMASRPLA